MPNVLAYLVLVAWPLVSLILFRRLPARRAVAWTLLGGYLLLPPRAEFDLPLVPDLHKFSIASICAFVFAIVVARDRVWLLPRFWPARILLAGFVLSAIPTVLTNTDPIVFQAIANTAPITVESVRLPGLRLLDVLSVLSNQIIVLMPFLLGFHYFRSHEGLRDLLSILLIGALAYSLPALIEIRLSPQLNTWIYGFFQHDFWQMMRDGGFRPIVFLPHALWLALFFVSGLVAAAAFARSAERAARPRYVIAVIYLVMIVFLCKSLASMLYALALLPVLFLASPRQQVAVAVSFAVLAVTWPMLRNLGAIPIDWILAQAEWIDPDRAQSLGFRFDNENRLLERAGEKPLFGWGGWGRNLVRDSATAEILTIPDGRWIITFGTYGWVGYISEMGLLATPIFLLARQGRGQGARAFSSFVAPVVLILAITMVDMLLNDTLVPFVWLIAGATLGHAERLRFREDTVERQQPLAGPGVSAVLGRRKPDGKRTVL